MIQDLLQKYNVPVPRYTSYPPANYFTDAFTNKEYESAIEASNEALPGHISFLCTYPVLPPSLSLLRMQLISDDEAGGRGTLYFGCA